MSFPESSRDHGKKVLLHKQSEIGHVPPRETGNAKKPGFPGKREREIPENIAYFPVLRRWLSKSNGNVRSQPGARFTNC
jgi:hypothetical protein